MKRNGNTFRIIGITAFFLGCFFLLILFGTGVYRNIVSLHSDTYELRSLSSYLLTVSKMGEADISHTEGEHGAMLMIEDRDSGYGNRIYLYDGYLVEDYGELGGRLFPDAAIRIDRSDLFEIKELDEDLLRIETDAGTVYIHLQEVRP